MTTIETIFSDVVDDDRFPALANFVADRGFNLEFAARSKPERDIVFYATGNPSVSGYARNSGEPHARCATYNVKDGRHRFNAANRKDVSFDSFNICPSTFSYYSTGM